MKMIIRVPILKDRCPWPLEVIKWGNLSDISVIFPTGWERGYWHVVDISPWDDKLFAQIEGEFPDNFDPKNWEYSIFVGDVRWNAALEPIEGWIWSITVKPAAFVSTDDTAVLKSSETLPSGDVWLYAEGFGIGTLDGSKMLRLASEEEAREEAASYLQEFIYFYGELT